MNIISDQSTEDSIEAIDIDPSWFFEKQITISSSKVVGKLPQKLTFLSSLVVRDQMIIFGGQNFFGVSNSAIYVLSSDNFTATTLPVTSSISYYEASFALQKGNLL